MIYTYIIPFLPPSLNRFAGRQNVFEYRNLKKYWKDEVSFLYRPKPPKPIESAKVTLQYYFQDKRRRDPDNFSGKLILDGLTAAGIIADDSFGCIQLVILGGYDKTNPRTEIIVEELEKEGAT